MVHITVGGVLAYTSAPAICIGVETLVPQPEPYTRGCTPLHNCCSDMCMGVDPFVYHRKWCTPVCKCSGDIDKGVDPYTDHHGDCTPPYKCLRTVYTNAAVICTGV